MRALLALGLLLVASLPVAAQTTTFNTADCSPYITISNPGPGSGLTLTNIHNPNNNFPVTCQANVGKYSDKWYFQAVAHAIGWGNYVGIANLGYAQAHFTSGSGLGSDQNSVGYVLTGGSGPVKFGPNSQRTTASIPYTTGNTIGFAVDMDSNPRQIWVTPDITVTTGCGGGPVWNGDTTTWGAPVHYMTGAHSPCGGPGTGTGMYGPPDTGQTGLQFFLTGAYPAMTGQYINEPPPQDTFDFSASATLDAKIGSGGPGPIYLPWNTNGGAPSVPGPFNPQVRNIANAPAWQQNTAYTSFPNDDRVLAGPAYDPGTGLFTNGQPVYLWAVASGGGGTSGNNSTYAGHFGTAPCPSPANVGGTVAPGGHTGSGTAAWNNATHVTDGTVTWVCLTSVDYDSFTSASLEDVYAWAPSTPYFQAQFVSSNGGEFYSNYSGGVGGGSLTCTSGATAPTSSTFGASVSDGNCSWLYVGPSTGYSSQANVWPHQLLQSRPLGNSIAVEATPQYSYSVVNQLWWGGDARKTYQNGHNGEATQLWMGFHNNQLSDNNYKIACPGGATISNLTCYPLDITNTAAPGDAWGNNMDPAVDPLRFNPTKGASIFSDITWNGQVTELTAAGNGIALTDYQLTTNLQIQATSGAAAVVSDASPGRYYNGSSNFINDILDAGGGAVAAGTGEAVIYENDLIIERRTGVVNSNFVAGASSHYGSAFFDNTVIGPGAGACPLCAPFQQDVRSAYGPSQPDTGGSPGYNNLAFGWANELGTQPGNNDDWTFAKARGSATGTVLTITSFDFDYGGALRAGLSVVGVGVQNDTQNRQSNKRYYRRHWYLYDIANADRQS